MAEYRRFVAYVYEYQKEKKGSNCGFVKIEVRGEICRIELHLQCPGPVSYTHLLHNMPGPERGRALWCASYE